MDETFLNHKDAKVILELKRQMKHMVTQISKHSDEENLILPPEENVSISLKKHNKHNNGYASTFFAHSTQTKFNIATSKEINESICKRLKACNISF